MQLQWRTLRRDADDGIQFDLKALAVSHDSSRLYLKIDGHRDWGSANEWVMFIFFDTTGHSQMSELMQAPSIMLGGYGNYFFQVTPTDTAIVPLDDFVITNNQVSLSVSLADLGYDFTDNSLIPISVIFSGKSTKLVLHDAIPDLHLNDSYLVYSIYNNQNLALDNSELFLGPGQSVDLKLSLNSGILRISEHGMLLLIQTNAPSQAIRYLHIFPIADSGVPEDDTRQIPSTICVFNNFPNPFNSSTMLKYGLPRAEWVSISIYNLLGKRIRVLLNEKKVAGFHTIKWDGRNDAAQMTGSGIYIARIEAGTFSGTQKLLFLK